MDLVIHSATKYFGGHSDILGGVFSGARDLVSRVESWRKLLGGVLDPAAASADILEDLRPRCRADERQCQTAFELARRLPRTRSPRTASAVPRAREPPRSCPSEAGAACLWRDGDPRAAGRLASGRSLLRWPAVVRSRGIPGGSGEPGRAAPGFQPRGLRCRGACSGESELREWFRLSVGLGADQDLKAGRPRPGTAGLKSLPQLCVLAILLAGCPRPELRFGPAGEVTDPAVLLKTLRVRSGELYSLVGGGTLSLKTPHGGGNAAVNIAIQRPASLRAEVLGFFGSPVVTLATDGQKLEIFRTDSGEFSEGAATAQSLSRVVQVEMEPQDLVSLLFGDPPLLPQAERPARSMRTVGPTP